MKPAENEAFKDLSITYHWSNGYGYMVDYKDVVHYWHYIGPLANQHAYQAGTTYTGMKAYQLLQDIVIHDTYNWFLICGHDYDECTFSLELLGDGSPYLWTWRIDLGEGKLMTTKDGNLDTTHPLKHLIDSISDGLYDAKVREIATKLVCEEERLIKEGKIIPFDCKTVTHYSLFLNPNGTYDKVPTHILLDVEAIPTGEKYNLKDASKDIFAERELPVYKVMNQDCYENMLFFLSDVSNMEWGVERNVEIKTKSNTCYGNGERTLERSCETYE